MRIIEFFLRFYHYEQFESESIVFSGFRDLQAGSGSSALDWRGNRFEAKEVVVKDRIETTTEIAGTLAPDGATLEDCELKVFGNGKTENGTTWTETEKLALFNVPLARIDQKPEGTYLHYRVAGENALKKHVVSFSHRYGAGPERKLIWEPLPENHLGGIDEPSLDLRLFRPQTGNP